MDLNPTAEDRAFRTEVRRWPETNAATGDVKTLDERKAWHRKIYEAGYVGMLWPKEYGGWGRPPMQQAIVQDEMARLGAPPPINGLGIGFIGPTIIVHGTDWQKQRYLKTMLTAEEIWCQLYSEPNAGSDLASLKTRAEDQGDHFLVNGQKIWTSSGPIADWGILLARTDAKAPKHKGISCVLLHMRQPGVEVRPLKQITGSSLFSEVFMTNARAEKRDLIGGLNQGWEIAQTTLGYERCRRSRRASRPVRPRRSPSSRTPSSRSATTSWRSRSWARGGSSSPRTKSSRRSTPRPASPARGRPRFCGRGRARSTRARPRSRRTSSANACSACPRKYAPTA